MKIFLRKAVIFLQFCGIILAFHRSIGTKRHTALWEHDLSSTIDSSSPRMTTTKLGASKSAITHLQKQAVPTVNLFRSAINENSKYVVKFLLVSPLTRKVVLLAHFCVIAGLVKIVLSDAFQKNIQMAVTSIKQLTVDTHITSGRKVNVNALRIWFLHVYKRLSMVVNTMQANRSIEKNHGRRNAVIKESNYLLVERTAKERIVTDFQKEKMTQEKLESAELINAEAVEALELSQPTEEERDHIVKNERKVFDRFYNMNMTTGEIRDCGVVVHLSDDINVTKIEEKEIVHDDTLRIKEMEKEERIQENVTGVDLKIVEELKSFGVMQALEIKGVNMEERNAKMFFKKEEKSLKREENDEVRTVAFAKLKADHLSKHLVRSNVKGEDEIVSLTLKEETAQEKLKEAQINNNEEMKSIEVTQSLEVERVNREDRDAKSALILEEITVQEKLKEAQLKNVEEIKALELIQAEEALRRGGAEAIKRDEMAFEVRKQERTDRLAIIVKAKEVEEKKLAATLLKLEEETKALIVAKDKAHQSRIALEKTDLELQIYHQSNDITASNTVVNSSTLEIAQEKAHPVFEVNNGSNPGGFTKHVIPSVATVPFESLVALTEKLANPSTNLQNISVVDHKNVGFIDGEDSEIEAEIMLIPLDFEVEAEVLESNVEEKEKEEREREEQIVKSSIQKEEKKRMMALEKEEQKKQRDVAFAKLKADQLEKQSALGFSSLDIDEIHTIEEKAAEDKRTKIALEKEEQKRVRDSAFAKLKADQLKKQSSGETFSEVDVTIHQPVDVEGMNKESDDVLIKFQQLPLRDEEMLVVDREAEVEQLSFIEEIATIKAQKDEEYKARTIAFAKQRADQLAKQKTSAPSRAAIEIENAPVFSSGINEVQGLESVMRAKEDKEEEERQAAILEDWKVQENFLGLVREPSQNEVAELESMRVVEERKKENMRKLDELKAITEAKRAIDLSRARSIFEEMRIEMDVKEKKIEEAEDLRKKEAGDVLKSKFDKDFEDAREVGRQAEMRRAELQVLQKKVQDEARAEMNSIKQEKEAKMQQKAAKVAFQLKRQEEETLKQAILKKKVAESEFALSLETRQKEAGERFRRGQERQLALLDLKIAEEEMLMEVMLKEERESQLALNAFKVIEKEVCWQFIQHIKIHIMAFFYSSQYFVFFILNVISQKGMKSCARLN